VAARGGGAGGDRALHRARGWDVIGLALVLALAAGPRVPVDLLTKQAPRTLGVRGEGVARSLAARGDGLLVDGHPVPGLALPAGTWHVEVPGERTRTYHGALSIRAERGALKVRGELELEPYVAAVVASETPPGTPAAALEAQAVAVRSYALAARDRHPGAALCDLAHCQILRGGGIPRGHLAASERAARATAGEVLVLPSGEVAAAAFHASCGGHTADPREAFGGEASGGAAGPDPGCSGPTWHAEVDPARLAGAVRLALAGDPAAAAAVGRRLRAAEIVVSPGAGGWIARVEGADARWRLSGDAFARALDAALGRGRVRSSRFTLDDVDGSVAVRGTGHGHGVGLCQAGAARRAAAGEDHRAILARYFRAEVVARRPSAAVPRARE